MDIINVELEEIEDELKDGENDSVEYNPLCVEHDDSLGFYLKTISEISLLKPKEERILAFKIVMLRIMLPQCIEPEKEEIEKELQRSEEKMVVSNLRLVVSVAKEHTSKVQGKMDLLDLIEEGNIGLIKAVEKFDPAKGYKFSTYAYWWIRQAINRAIADYAGIIRLPVHIIEGIRGVNRIIEELGGIATTESIVASFKGKYSEEKVQNILRAKKLGNITSLNNPLSLEEDGKNSNLADFIENLEPSPEERVLNNSTSEEIMIALEDLNEKERAVLILRFGLNDGAERTLQQVGSVFNISRERVRQIQDEALLKLRHPKRASVLRELLEK